MGTASCRASRGVWQGEWGVSTCESKSPGPEHLSLGLRPYVRTAPPRRTDTAQRSAWLTYANQFTEAATRFGTKAADRTPAVDRTRNPFWHTSCSGEHAPGPDAQPALARRLRSSLAPA